jgi:hypothetical protein
LRIFNRLMIYLALAFATVNSLLAMVGQKDIQVYFILDLIAYLVVTLLFVYLNPRARGALTTVSTVFFSAFGVIVVLKIVSILKP